MGSEEGKEEGDAIVGSYVGKEAAGSRKRVLLGKVVSFDADRRLYNVVYEDGHREDVEYRKICENLEGGSGGSGMKMSSRKRKLDQLVSSGVGEVMMQSRPNTRSRKNDPEASDLAARPSSDLSDDDDSSSNSCDNAPAPESLPEVEFPPLPPSSGDIAVPEEAISHLFSVYNFLRSFSVELFLSPFGLDDFVGSLNCTVQNNLLDAVHLSLLQALRRHLQMLSSEGSELASKCLRFHDWNLLDTLTWPAFLLEYLYVMRYMKYLGGGKSGFSLSDREYYWLPVASKLTILQILCDDVSNSAELKTELEIREGFDEELEYNMDASLTTESGPRRVHPRNSRTSICKSIQALENSVEHNIACPSSKLAEHLVDSSDTAQDGNSDECRLCEMDGTLICCDGCPSAYHSRCIGLNKAFLPDGLWFCPECTVNKLGMTSSKIERGARGAEIFGVDVSGRMFLGACNYLLVIGTSCNEEPFSRYYNKDDVSKVLHLICSTDEIATAYANICRRISEYWDFSPASLPNGKIVSPINPLCNKESSLCYAPSSIVSTKNGSLKVEELDSRRTAESSADNREILLQKYECHKIGADRSELNLFEQSKFSEMCNITNNDVLIKEEVEGADKTLLLCPKDQNHAFGGSTPSVHKVSPVLQKKLTEQIANGSVVTDLSYSNQPLSSERSNAPDPSTFSPGIVGTSREDTCSSIFSGKSDSVGLSHGSRHGNQFHGEKCKFMSGRSSTVPASFKPQAYINQYIYGSVAASAAANLAVLTSEEGRVLESHVASNRKKTVSADIVLQMKAFSAATLHFVWPNPEKKLMEVPRERCGWCIACRGATVNKKGCLLNLAATNAIKSSAKYISGVRPIKYGESHFPSVIAYIANMEESLRGLIVGPFQDVQYKQFWHKQLREASRCRDLKLLLLELEKNIRGIAFIGGWFKMEDDWSIEFPALVAGASRIRANKKRGTGGKRNRKRSVASDVVVASSEDNWKDVQWWCGGKLSKVVFPKGAIHSSLIRKAARQGGFRRISGITYPESSDFPRRSRQFTWRASLEMSRSVSHLALQVRYLDAHIRWRDLAPPDQTSLDGKGLDSDVSAFRNAVICDKKMVENKMVYAIRFSNQKHLPVRVTKNILEAENNQDENGRLWFSESHIPLYLIKDYEEKAEAKPSISIRTLTMPKSQGKLVKSYRGNIFNYLFHKGEKPSKTPCASCKCNVLLRDAVRCSSCQGDCHKDCIPSWILLKYKDPSSDLTCKACYRKLHASRRIISSGQLAPQKISHLVIDTKSALLNGFAQTAQLGGKLQAQVETKSTDLSSNSVSKRKHSGACLSYGLIWKKKKSDETGKDFRLQHIILKSKEEMTSSRKPTCCLCNMPYRSDLMYIRCEKCLKWYHADAVQLEESQIFDLVGFKCCKCRRKSSPRCPYVNPDYKRPEPEILSNGNASQETKSSILNLANSSGPSPTNEVLVIVNDDHLFSSSGIVEPIAEQTIEQLNLSRAVSHSQQKLSVRRPQVKQMADFEVDHTIQNTDHTCAPLPESPSIGTNTIVDAEEMSYRNASGKASSPVLEWDFSQGDGYVGVVFSNADGKYEWNDPKCGNSEDVQYEPQTYFSFTELLASDDPELDNPFDLPMDMPEDECFPSDFDELQTSFDETHGDHDAETANAYYAIDGPTSSGLVCQKCKLQQPLPDLKCEVCGLHIHAHCSPWVESEDPSDDSSWKCGGCREWR
ncbi:DDT domain-containing protein PTM-like [Typha latifolia]|uniref:DDT domain-containing protein PTM-like n=1 Tax=Typha latifolia TaxID=4733 RepID=UPI003C3086D3